MKTLLTTLAVSTALTAPAFAQEAGSRDARGQLHFEGRYLISVQDSDMVSSAYVNGQLGPREASDTLAVIALDGDPLDPGNTQLFKTEHSVPVARGAHSMVIAR